MRLVDRFKKSFGSEKSNTSGNEVAKSPLELLKPFYVRSTQWTELSGEPSYTFEQFSSFLLPKLKTGDITEERIERLLSLSGKFANWTREDVDAYSGSGWLPPYKHFVEVSPPILIINNYYDGIDNDILLSALPELKPNNKLCCFHIVFPKKEGVTASQMETFWSSLQNIHQPVSFEIVGIGDTEQIIFQFLCSSQDKKYIVNLLSSLFSVNPEGDEDYLTKYKEDDYIMAGKPFGLNRHYSFLLKTFRNFTDSDPLNSLMTPFATLRKEQGAILQALVSPVKSNWIKQLEYIHQLAKEYHYDQVKGYPAGAKMKHPLFGVCLRVMTFSKNDNLKSFPTTVKNAFSPFNSPNSNQLTEKPAERSFPSFSSLTSRASVVPILTPEELKAVLTRDTYRPGFILNSRELACLLHFPSKALQHPKLLRQEEGIKEAPEEMTKDGLLIGINAVHGKEQEVYVPADYRFRHIYVVGKTGTGKTTLLLNMIKSDIDAGKGVGVIDPHGDLVRDKILPIIPEHRIDDVILFDPTDFDHPIGFNMLQVHSEVERRLVNNEITATLRRLFEQWSNDINTLFRNSAATLLADRSQTYTLLDIRKLITDDYFRYDILERIDDEYLQEFWAEDFEGMQRTTVPAVKRRLSTLLGQPEVRAVLGQRETTFNVREMMDGNKIFLANIPRGELGEEVSTLFGGLLVSKIQLTAMARASQVEAARVPFHLYVDEFQNFTNESFDIILSEARKYRLCLTMAHQFTAQLSESIREAVFGNVGTIISFELGVKDATSLAKELNGFTVDNILDLPNYHAYTRIGRARDAFSMRTYPPPQVATDFSAEIRRRNRERYCRKPEPKKVKPKPDEVTVKQEQDDEDKWFQ